jgi:hypothetical protein
MVCLQSVTYMLCYVLELNVCVDGVLSGSGIKFRRN